MTRTRLTHILLGVITSSLVAQTPTAPPSKAQVVKTYAAMVHGKYVAVRKLAGTMHERIQAFCKAPSKDRLAAARAAWIAARKIYGQTEAFRFYNGPIDNDKTGVETLVNAWPLDEAYIDGIKDRPDAGLVQDPTRFPNLNGFVLTLANERNGETNVCVGWHAIEFMLWGQDHDPKGPGRRSPNDFVDGQRDHADRRRQYLLAVSELLLRHLDQMVNAWAPDTDNYRQRFESDTDESLRKIVTGIVVLSGFELGGERTAVALETKDQEDEHSCFSDTTHFDYIANQQGILDVYHGIDGPGLQALARRAAPKLAADVAKKLKATMATIRKIPLPFDQAITAPDGSPAHRAVEATVRALEAQTDTLAALGLALGFEVPLTPGG